MKETTYTCLSCNQTFSTSADRAGKTARCWACGIDVPVPSPALKPAPRPIEPKVNPIEPTQRTALPPKPPRTKTPKKNLKPARGVLKAGWICFSVGLLLMICCFLISFYIPLFVTSFILSIVAIAQSRVRAGIGLLLSTLIIPAITGVIAWILLFGATALTVTNAIQSSMPSLTSSSSSQTIYLPESSQSRTVTTSTRRSFSVPQKRTTTPISHRASTPKSPIRMKQLLSKIDYAARGLRDRPTSVVRNDIFNRARSEMKKMLVAHTLLFTATVTDIRKVKTGIYRVSFSNLEDGGLRKNRAANITTSPNGSVNLKMSAVDARDISKGNKITVRGKATLGSGTFLAPNLLLTITDKSSYLQIATIHMTGDAYTIHR